MSLSVKSFNHSCIGNKTETTNIHQKHKNPTNTRQKHKNPTRMKL